MAVKKSELYSSIWASCDELRGGMDASQYKDYVLVMLFVKYISDKYAGVPYAPITVPKGASFKDMVALKGNPNIGDLINKKIIGPIADANKLDDMPDFNDVTKLGSGKEQVDRLTNLIAIFEDKGLDFSKNRADGDDLLGDAYEYLMRHFATESGKSKGQFYTPAEVSRIIAKIIGISKESTTAQTSVYDPTCGSGSLLLKVAEEAERSISLFGQEKDSATSGLARMNFILHDSPSAVIRQGNTLANPHFLDGNGKLKTFDYVVANPPFSDKRWGNGVDKDNDPHGRFTGIGVPPDKNGDYAYLLHIVRSLKPKGKGACILPHGVLFRGNAEAAIRENLVRKGYIKGIIGLPPNLFYGTSIPACIVVIDKENAQNRKGLFMIDASKGFMKDDNKNRLRSMDIHKIVDVFNNQIEWPKYSRIVPITEIEKNEFNLNIPRYINSQELEDIQDIEAHLLGGIPQGDVDALEAYWKVYPSLKSMLFTKSDRKGYLDIKIPKENIRQTIFSHPEFEKYAADLDQVFIAWKKKSRGILKALKVNHHPKKVILELSEDLLERYSGKDLLDNYDMYQRLMDYWAEVMQDDCYVIADEGWKATIDRIVDKNSKGKEIDKGWTCDLVPKQLVIDRFFKKEKEILEELQSEKERVTSELAGLEEEHSGEEGFFADMEKVNKGAVQKRLRELEKVAAKELMAAAESAANYGQSVENSEQSEYQVLKQYLDLSERQSSIGKEIKEAEIQLDEELLAKYKNLTEDEIKTLVVDDKWLASIRKSVWTEMDRISQRLTLRIKELTERYEAPLPRHETAIIDAESSVKTHLGKMGFKWS